MFIRSRNETIKPPQRGFDIKLLCRYDVSLLLAWGFISMLGYIALLFSLSDFARSIGLSHTEAATVSAFLNLGSAIGRPFIGLISDYYGRMETAGLLTFGSGITCFVLWLPATSYGLTIVFAIINGAVLGVFWVVSFQNMLLWILKGCSLTFVLRQSDLYPWRLPASPKSPRSFLSHGYQSSSPQPVRNPTSVCSRRDF